MRHIVAVHIEGAEHLEHIELLQWYESAGPNLPNKGALRESVRQEIYDFVNGGGNAFAFNNAHTAHAMLEAVDGPNVQYVKTVPDRVKSDNLLSLPRF